MSRNRDRNSNRHKKWEQRRNQSNKGEATVETTPALQDDFSSALQFGLGDCAFDFARSVGLRAKDLRAMNSGRAKPTDKQETKIIIEATQRGWKPAVQENI